MFNVKHNAPLTVFLILTGFLYGWGWAFYGDLSHVHYA